MKKLLLVVSIIGAALSAGMLPCFALAATGGPTAVISSTLSPITNVATIPVTVTFSSPVNGFTAGVVQVSGPATLDASSFTGSGAQYSFNLNATANGTIGVTVPADVATDTNNIGNQVAQFSIGFDTVMPHVALSPDPLPIPVSGPFTVSVNFTIAVTDFTVNKITVTGGAASNLASTSSDGRNFSFTVTPVAGPVSVSLPGGVVHTAANNANVPSNILKTRLGPVLLSGTVWQDVDANGTRSASDPGLSGWTVIAAPVNSDGTPDSSRQAISTTTDSSGHYSIIFSTAQYGNWAIAPQVSGQWLLTSGATSTVTAAVDSNFSQSVDYGFAAYVPAGNGILFPINGTATSAQSFAMPSTTATTISLGLVEGTSTMQIPPSTRIGNEDGTFINLNELLKSISTSQAGTNITINGVLRWGLHASGLVYNQPVTFSLAVPGNSGDMLSIMRSESANLPWTGSGIVSPGTCVVISGICTFQATISPLNPLSAITYFNSNAPTITAASLVSNNASTSLANIGNTVTLTFTASKAVRTPVVTILGHAVTVATTSATTTYSYKASYKVVGTDTVGPVTFSISVTDLSGNTINTPATATTDGTGVIFSLHIIVNNITGQAWTSTDTLYGTNGKAASETWYNGTAVYQTAV
ncbi:MAG: Ig-like domain-containing protein, partial [Minisyncoccia bacterium]